MKTYAAIIAVAAATASAQLSAMPSCALAPTTQAVSGSGCALTDIKCICGNSKFIGSLEPILAKACSMEDQEKALKAAQGLCAQAGATLAVPADMSTAAAPAAYTSASMASSMTAPAPASGTGMMPAPAANGTMSGATGAKNGTSTGSASSSPAAATYTGAAAKFQWAVGAVAAAAGAVVALA